LQCQPELLVKIISLKLHHSHTIKLFVLAMFLVSILSCQNKDENIESNSIIESIESLLERPSPEASVIFETEPTKYIVQFFNSDEEIYFDIPIHSKRLKDSPIIQEVGDIEEKSPNLSGDVIEEKYIDPEQLSALKFILNSYDLNFIIGFKTGYDSHNDKIIGSHELLRGKYTLDPSETEEFLQDIFELALALRNYDIKIIEN